MGEALQEAQCTSNDFSLGTLLAWHTLVLALTMLPNTHTQSVTLAAAGGTEASNTQSADAIGNTASPMEADACRARAGHDQGDLIIL